MSFPYIPRKQFFLHGLVPPAGVTLSTQAHPLGQRWIKRASAHDSTQDGHSGDKSKADGFQLLRRCLGFKRAVPSFSPEAAVGAF